MDIDSIVKAVVQATLAANAASIAAKTPAPSPASTLTQPAGRHHPSASNSFFLKAWNGYLDSLPIFQSFICAWFDIPSFAGIKNFSTTPPG